MSQALLAGTPYRMIAPLGRGGMGEVVEAEHIALGKRVVVKLLHLQLADRPDLADRMRVEAQALARLVHPNLVAVTDLGQTPDGRTYLVMERLHGRTLREELAARGVLPAAEAIDFACQALAGLAAAHEAGIVHRDVKLDNLFVCDPGPGGAAPPGAAPRRVVKVLDFGIAKVLHPGDGRSPAPLAFPTEEGVSVGTPRFFSPEQARGQAVDARTDVYAMGVVLYTLCAGRGPFDHIQSIYELTRAHALEVPRLPSEASAVPIPPELERAIMKALEKKPDDRFQSAGELAAELTRARDAEARRPAAGAGERRALDARATVRMPELADRQDQGRQQAQAALGAPRPAAGRPPEAFALPPSAAAPAVAPKGTQMLLEAPGPLNLPTEALPPISAMRSSAAYPAVTAPTAIAPARPVEAAAPIAGPIARAGGAPAAPPRGAFVLILVASALVFAALAAVVALKVL